MRIKKSMGHKLSLKFFQYSQSIIHLLERRRKDLFRGTFTGSAQDSAVSVSLKFSHFKKKVQEKSLNSEHKFTLTLNLCSLKNPFAGCSYG